MLLRCCVHLQPLQEVKSSASILDNRTRDVQERCFQRRDSLHHNMCYCFTTFSGTEATQRSQTVKAKMEECDSGQFIAHFFFLDADTLHDGDFTASSRRNWSWKKCWQGWRVDSLRWGSISLEKGADGDTWSDVMFQYNMSALWQVRSVDARETKQNFKLEPKCNYWFLCF